jgi:hypothetical protein
VSFGRPRLLALPASSVGTKRVENVAVRGVGHEGHNGGPARIEGARVENVIDDCVFYGVANDLMIDPWRLGSNDASGPMRQGHNERVTSSGVAMQEGLV